MSKKRGKNRKPAAPAPKAAPVKSAPPPTAIPAKGAAEKKPFPIKTAVIATAMVLCVAAGAWLALSPTLEKNKALEQQNALIDSIEQGGGEIVLDAALAAADVDFYDDSGEESAEPGVPAAPSATETPEAAPTTESEVAAPADTVITGIGVLSIEKIGVKLPVTDGVTTAQLKVAAGHVRGTPEIGGAGNSIIAGHRSYTDGQFFNRLGEMAVGDVIHYQPKDGEAMEFTVFEILEVEPGDPAALYQPEGKNIITLLTCTPIRTATHRLLVRAELINQ
jgi:sortase A